jgi:hypothetical protein
MTRKHIAEAIRADSLLDIALASYAEHGQPETLAVCLTLSERVTNALRHETRRHVTKRQQPRRNPSLCCT